MVQQHRKGDKEEELEEQAPCRVLTQQDAGDEGADHGEHTRLHEGIGNQLGHLPLAASQTVMPGRKSFTTTSGSSLNRKLLRS